MNLVQTEVAGRYRLEGVIGRGGMSTVYRATDLVLGRIVAVKVLSPALADGDPAFVARFEREARAAAALSHSAVVMIYDAGSDGEARFIAMEYVPGRSLDVVLRSEAPLQARRAVAIAERVAGALRAAHAAGIVHRDIKPANVMVADDGSVKVLDFGIARATNATALTQATSVLGTAAYMAPEQASGRPADARSDIYSLGCVLYAMLTGHPPFSGEVPAAVMHKHLHEAPPPIRTRSRAVSPALEELVLQMLAKAPAARPQTAAEVRDRLRALEAPPPATGVTAVLPRARRRSPLPPARRAAAAALAATALVIAIAAIASGGGSGGPRPAAQRAPAPVTTRQQSTTATQPATSVASPAPAPPPPKHHRKHHHHHHGGG